MTETTWLDDAISWGDEVWKGIVAIGEELFDGVLLFLLGVCLMGFLFAVGPSILLLLAGAPAWAALLLLF